MLNELRLSVYNSSRSIRGLRLSVRVVSIRVYPCV